MTSKWEYEYFLLKERRKEVATKIIFADAYPENEKKKLQESRENLNLFVVFLIAIVILFLKNVNFGHIHYLV